MTSLNLSIRVENLERVRDALNKLSGQQANQAYANAINDAAWKARNAMVQELRTNFDRPTPFIANAPKVFPATADKLTAFIQPTLDTRNEWRRGGKIGVDPQHVLQAQEFGGRRADKRSEKVLRSAGILPVGYQTAIPGEKWGGPFPGSDDGNGNLKGQFLRSVLAFLQSFLSGQGSTQNMSAAAKHRVRQFGRGTISKRAQQQAGPFLGRRYFISYGKQASPFGKGIVRNDSALAYGRNRSAHFPAGIWAVVGVGEDARVRPVLLFVRTPAYRPRISMERIAQSADLQNYLDRRVRARVRNLSEGKPA